MPTRPRFEITTELLENVEKLASQGLTQEQISSVIGVRPETFSRKKKINDQLNQAVKRGQHKGIDSVTNSLKEKAESGDTTAMIFYLKNRDNHNWQDNPDKRRKFKYDKKLPPSDQALQIMEAASDGIISHDSASIMMNSLATLLKIEDETKIRDQLDANQEKIDELIAAKRGHGAKGHDS